MAAVTNRDGSKATGLTMAGQRRAIHNRNRTCLPVNEAASRPGGARIIGETMAASNPARVMTAMAMKSDPATNAIRGITAAADMSEEQMDSC